MDFNTETYAGSLLKDFREALSIPNLSIGDVLPFFVGTILNQLDTKNVLTVKKRRQFSLNT